MRKCLKCGQELPDVAMKCDVCGSDELSFIENTKNNKTTAKKPKSVIIIAAVIAVSVILAIIFTYSYFKTSVQSEPVKNAVIALTSGDLQGYLDEIPQKMQTDTENYYVEQNGSIEAFKSQTESALEENFGEKYSIDAKVIDSYDFSEDLIESLNSACKDKGYDLSFESGKHITLRLMVESKDGKTKNYSAVEAFSVSTNGKWYYLPNEIFEETNKEQTAN